MPRRALWGATPNLLDSSGPAAQEIAAIAGEVDSDSRHQAGGMSVNRKKLPKAIRSTADELLRATPMPAAERQLLRTSARCARGADDRDRPAAPVGIAQRRRAGLAALPPLTGVVIHPGSPADASSASIDSEHRLIRARAIVERHATYSALGGLIPLPIVNVGAVTTVILRMVKSLSDLYGVPFERDRARGIVLGLMGGAMPTGLAAVTTSTLLYVIPGSNLVGLAVSSIAAAACTRSIGRIFVERFEHGTSLNDFRRPQTSTARLQRCARTRTGAPPDRSRCSALTSLAPLLHRTLSLPHAMLTVLGMKREMPIVEVGERRAMTDRHDRGARQSLVQQPVQLGLRRLVQRGRRLVQEQIVRSLQNRPCNGETLLLAERQNAIPMRFLGHPLAPVPANRPH